MSEARLILEAENPKGVFKQIATPANRIAGMRFKSKDEVNIGTKVLHRMTDYGFKGNLWDKANDAWYRTTGSDHHRVSSFWHVPPGRDVSSWSTKQVPKEQSTHLELTGVGGSMLSWDEFFKECIKPELYYPKLKKHGMAFERPPGQRFEESALEIVEAENPKGVWKALRGPGGGGPIKSIAIWGRRWFARLYGNTYHSAYIYVNDKLVHTIPFSYGYGDQYLWNAFDWLEQNQYIKRHRGNGSAEAPWRYCERMGIKLTSDVTDVRRKKDL